MIKSNSSISKIICSITQQSSPNPELSMIKSTSLSELTDDKEMNCNPFNMQRVPHTVTIASKLNFKTGRAAHVARILLHESDILEAHEQNKTNVEKGKEAKIKLERAKKINSNVKLHAILQVWLVDNNIKWLK